MKFLFFFLGVPMMLLSFFEVVDVLPYVQYIDIVVDGNTLEITEEQQDKLQEQVLSLFEGSHTLPAFGVVTDEMYRNEIQNGTYVSLKFGAPIEINGLPFDELVFKIEQNLQSFNLYRGMKGIFQGRCIYVDLMNKDMTAFYEFVTSIPAVDDAIQSREETSKEETAEKNEDNLNENAQEGEVKVFESSEMKENSDDSENSEKIQQQE